MPSVAPVRQGALRVSVMDEISDGSPWMPVLLAIDYTDRFFHSDIVTASLLFVIIPSYFYLLGSRLDLLLTGIVLAFTNGEAIVSWIRDSTTLHTLALYSAFILVSWTAFRLAHSSFSVKNTTSWSGPGRPYLIPSRTSHTRMFPKKHSFAYSYLITGVPVGYKGDANEVISVDAGEQSSLTRAWYHVDAADYLERGRGDLGLRGKLDNYLKSQGADPADFPHAYLLTAARFLGYHFNPVSFWYLYSADKVLSAVVLEVNNTFGERRPYLLLRDFAEETKHLAGRNAVSPATRVKGSLAKDFHVSPFNSRKGSYSVLASDPLGPDMEGFRGIDITINLSSSKGHPKLVARLFSEGDAVDPATLGVLDKAKFLLSWFWVGFVTFPRIVKEAAVLFFKHKLHVWYRPEPLKESLGRHADRLERDMEMLFRRYLQFCVQQSPNAVSVTYIPSGVTDIDKEVYVSAAAEKGPGEAEQIEMRVLTPIFYTRFVRYAHDFEAIFSELTENGTIWVDKPHVLPDIFLKKGASPLHASGLVDFATFKLIQRLRRRPDRIPFASTSVDPPVSSSSRVIDIRDFRISPMDAYILAHDDDAVKRTYQSAVLRVLMADHLFLGSTELLGAVLLGLRLAICYLSATSLDRVLSGLR
ncbi:hypothetical protein O9K51_04454 [Purpureocillium lavendulum]|uniref:DNA-binding WRKY domain-containing protein n=1 Tax=Purpureocillium lavendulum TaxID=1247861 RepID=A0AB34FVC3_9HYPO|nr:hypothetical protein O9K51_04454 [Purpureocillium lavendulum]